MVGGGGIEGLGPIVDFVKAFSSVKLRCENARTRHSNSWVCINRDPERAACADFRFDYLSV